ncbi:MAG: recombinase RecA [Clostridia bacterium]|nr:recombinase RecA [Clostridia bacterium]
MLDKEKALEIALAQIEKQFGKGAIMKLGDASANLNISAIPTGCIDLDIALGVGGVPRGRIIEVFGPESSGKTTIALHVVAQAQKMGGTAAFIDAEHALDPVYAESLGVNVDDLYVSQPDTGEQALEITESLVRSGAIDVVVVDSVAALVPKAEIEGDMGDSHVGLQARLMSQALRKLTGAINKSNCVVIFINQLREKVGGEAIGSRTKVKVVKNKVAPPFRTAEFDMLYGEGISREGSVIDQAVARKIMTKSGAWFNYGEMRIAQGRDNPRQFLKDTPELCDEIENKIRAQVEEEKKKAQAEAEQKRAARRAMLEASRGDAPTL